MDEIYIKTNNLASWIADEYFYGKDIISIDELYTALEDTRSELEHVREEFNDYKEYVRSNYKEMSIAEQVE